MRQLFKTGLIKCSVKSTVLSLHGKEESWTNCNFVDIYAWVDLVFYYFYSFLYRKNDLFSQRNIFNGYEKILTVSSERNSYVIHI